MRLPSYIIVDIGSSNCGKTTTLNNVWDMLPCYDPSEKVVINGVNRNGIIGFVKTFSSSNLTVDRNYSVGLNANGDTVHDILYGLEALASNDCDIIVCCARSIKAFEEALQLLFDNHKIERTISNNPHIIRFSHFSKWPYDTVGIRNKKITGILSCVNIGNANLSRISAQAIINLIEQLLN